MSGTVELTKLVPKKKHFVAAAKVELPRMWIPVITLCFVWVSALLLIGTR